MHRILLSLLLLPLLGSAADQAVTEEDPWLQLEKAAEAAHKLNYKGVFVLQTGRTVNSFHIMHTNFGTAEFAHVVMLDGAPREVLRNGNDVVIYQPKSEKVMIEKRHAQSSFPAILPAASSMLKANYQIKQTGQERVGGRDGLNIQLDPRDKLRYGYYFCVDRQSGLLLKSVTVNEKNEVVEQIAFSQLGLVNNPDMEWFHPNVDREKVYVMQPEEKVAPAGDDDDDWVIGPLPAGFRKVEHMHRHVHGKDAAVSHLVFSDGLASVSLFIEPLDKNKPPRQGNFVQGATNVFANTVDGRQIIVVGEVPEATVRQVAAAVSFKK